MTIRLSESGSVRSDLNTSYLFIPFIFRDKFSSLITDSNDPMEVPTGLRDHWEVPSTPLYQKDANGNTIYDDAGNPVFEKDESGKIRRIPIKDNRYLFRYIADKKDMYCHYQLNAEALVHWECSHFWEYRPHRTNCDNQPFSFKVQSVHLYCFRTQIGILAYRIKFQTADPFEIANQLYHLKNVEKFQLWVTDKVATSFNFLSQQIINQTGMHASPDDFFFFAQSGTARANILTHIEVPMKKNYRKELYYLRWCYTPTMPYTPNRRIDRHEIYIQSKNIQWGISPEAAVCLTIPELGNEQFLHGSFDRSFNTSYLYTYILLLHHKFVLYKFMTEIDSDHIQLSKLQEYQMELSKFENDYVYSRISEVAQYQNFYKRAERIFRLRDMYVDIHEPLAELKAIQETNKDRRVARALGFISILTVFSALVDSYDFFGEVGDIGNNPELVQFAQICAIFIIFMILLFVIQTLWLSQLRERLKDRKRRNRLNKYK